MGLLFYISLFTLENLPVVISHSNLRIKKDQRETLQQNIKTYLVVDLQSINPVPDILAKTIVL